VTIPAELGGCKVLGTASVGPDTALTWGAQRNTGESADHPVRNLAIAEYPRHGFFLFSCDKDWNVIWDSLCDSIEDALATAHYHYDVRFAGLDDPS
jgi:hypothetical protein